MRPETFTLSQKELQRVTVLSSCLRGELACARAAELLSLSVRQVKRLKSEGHRGFRRSAEVHRRIGAREICDAQRVCVQE